MQIKQGRAVYLIAEYDGKIPMLLRENTGFLDGYWGLIAGRVEEDENLKDAMVREAKEEADLDLDRKDLELVHICNRLQEYNKIETGIINWLDVYFYVKNINKEPINNEPEKHSEVKIFAKDELPGNTMPYIKYALKEYFENKKYSEYGFKK
jgi:8-oxo-dGTP diphosphatase